MVKVYLTPSINIPCKVCGKYVNDNDRSIQCELYNYWIHINCNNLNYIDYKFLQNSSDPWYCILCCSQILPFHSMKSNKNISMCVSDFHNNNNKPGKTINNKGSLLLKPSENLKLLVNQFNNNASPEDKTDPENVVQSKCYDIDELQTIKIPNKDMSLALFHINACSLNKNFNELKHLLSCRNKNFDIIAISETRIKKIFL